MGLLALSPTWTALPSSLLAVHLESLSSPCMLLSGSLCHLLLFPALTGDALHCRGCLQHVQLLTSLPSHSGKRTCKTEELPRGDAAEIARCRNLPQHCQDGAPMPWASHLHSPGALALSPPPSWSSPALQLQRAPQSLPDDCIC